MNRDLGTTIYTETKKNQVLRNYEMRLWYKGI